MTIFTLMLYICGAASFGSALEDTADFTNRRTAFYLVVAIWPAIVFIALLMLAHQKLNRLLGG